MFKRVNQVQTVDVNEWTNKLLAARDDVRAVENIRRRLDDICANNIAMRAMNLEKREVLYDFYYEETMPSCDDFTKYIMDTIDYRMPDDLVEKWQFVCEQYRRIKAEIEEAKKNAAPVD